MAKRAHNTDACIPIDVNTHRRMQRYMERLRITACMQLLNRRKSGMRLQLKIKLQCTSEYIHPHLEGRMLRAVVHITSNKQNHFVAYAIHATKMITDHSDNNGCNMFCFA